MKRIVGGLPKAFWWLWAGAMVNSVAQFVFPFLALFLTREGMSLPRVGALVALFGGGSIVSGPIAGAVADRLGRRPTVVASLVATAALTLALAFVHEAWALGAVVLALGVAASAFRPVLNAVVADLVPEGDRGRAFGLVYWAVNVGMAISEVAGGMLAEHGYSLLFALDAATTLGFAGLIWLGVPETNPARAATGTAEASAGWRTLARDRDFALFLGVNFLFLVMFWQFQVTAPVDMTRHGLSTAQFGRVMAVNGILIGLLQPFAQVALRRFRPAHVLAAACVIAGVGYGAYAVCHSVWQYTAATALWSVGEIMALPVAFEVVAGLSPTDMRGRYQGAFSLSFGLGTLVAPIAGTAVLDRWGSTALWGGCLAIGVLVAGLHLATGAIRR